ncbi:transposase [Listeria sp. FSL L7-1509]|uniref:Transposase n=2 Tax=Listeria immobilis TaxID=2713502 RepID=A0ABR6SUI3_9LIST|nr:IS3 family transposase [Listeria immobilis]MBC1483956.1 transposase [Listeria immobilis]MBC1505388.1 transposase [Listeria immobilis]MBC1509180.1 transposase [Listeria immobilis]MBC6313623.1 transposase [Listeria immobilis]
MDYLETYYNYERIHSSLNYLTPHEFETMNEFA